MSGSMSQPIQNMFPTVAEKNRPNAARSHIQAWFSDTLKQKAVMLKKTKLRNKVSTRALPLNVKNNDVWTVETHMDMIVALHSKEAFRKVDIVVAWYPSSECSAKSHHICCLNSNWRSETIWIQPTKNQDVNPMYENYNGRASKKITHTHTFFHLQWMCKGHYIFKKRTSTEMRRYSACCVHRMV